MAVQADEQTAASVTGAPSVARRLPGWVVILAPALAELLVGGYRIAGPSFWRDEAATISGSNRSVTAILTLTRHQDAVHGLYYLLIHAVIAVGGTAETALRLPSLIAMALAAGLTAELGRLLARRTGLPSPGAIGLLAGLLLVVVPLTTRYAQEARPYALTTLFAVSATYLLVRAVGERRWPWWAAYAAAIVVMALFNLFALLLVAAHGLTLLAARPRPTPAAPTPTDPPAATPAPVTTVATPASSARAAISASATAPAPATTVATPARAATSASAAPATIPAPAARSTTSTRAATQAPATAPTPAAGAATPAPAATSASATMPAFGFPSASAANPAQPSGVALRWLVACGVAAVLVAPVAVFSVQQSGQLNWVTRPDPSTVATLVRDFAGATALIPVIGVLALLGCAAGPGLRRGAGLSLSVLALPWLIVPPVLLLAVSLADPLYVERYVMFCLPALSLLAAAGLVWLAELTRRAVTARGLAAGRERVVAVVPSALLALVILVALIGPQRAIRQPGARADNLRAVTAVVAANERPGDAVWYLPWDTALVGMAYPAPFTKLRNIGQAATPIASATLRGLPAAPGVVTARLRTASRVWTVQWIPPAPSAGQLDKTLATSGLHLIRRWQVQSVLLTLYAR